MKFLLRDIRPLAMAAKHLGKNAFLRIDGPGCQWRITDLQTEIEAHIIPLAEGGEVINACAASVMDLVRASSGRGALDGATIEIFPNGGMLTASGTYPMQLIETMPDRMAVADNCERGQLSWAKAADCARVAARGDSRFALEGVAVDLANGIYCASDMHRLIAYNAQKVGDPAAIRIIPQEAIAAGWTMADEGYARAGTDAMEIVGETYTLRTRLIQGQFPRFREVIPAARKTGYDIPDPRRLAKDLRAAHKLVPDQKEKSYRKVEFGETRVALVYRPGEKLRAVLYAKAHADGPRAEIEAHRVTPLYTPRAGIVAVYGIRYFIAMLEWMADQCCKTLWVDDPEMPAVAESSRAVYVQMPIRTSCNREAEYWIETGKWPVKVEAVA